MHTETHRDTHASRHKLTEAPTQTHADATAPRHGDATTQRCRTTGIERQTHRHNKHMDTATHRDAARYRHGEIATHGHSDAQTLRNVRTTAHALFRHTDRQPTPTHRDANTDTQAHRHAKTDARARRHTETAQPSERMFAYGHGTYSRSDAQMLSHRIT